MKETTEKIVYIKQKNLKGVDETWIFKFVPEIAFENSLCHLFSHDKTVISVHRRKNDSRILTDKNMLRFIFAIYKL